MSAQDKPVRVRQPHRVLIGLSEALTTAACEHKAALPFSTLTGYSYWACADCGGRFSKRPTPSPGERP